MYRAYRCQVMSGEAERLDSLSLLIGQILRLLQIGIISAKVDKLSFPSYDL
jgi:hypothetical protein